MSVWSDFEGAGFGNEPVADGQSLDALWDGVGRLSWRRKHTLAAKALHALNADTQPATDLRLTAIELHVGRILPVLLAEAEDITRQAASHDE
jgi:hypothetical protein